MFLNAKLRKSHNKNYKAQLIIHLYDPPVVTQRRNKLEKLENRCTNSE